MPEPIAFISHFRIKEGQLDGLRELARGFTGQLDAAKPRTIAYLAYVDPDRAAISFVHVFADAEAMDLHFQGSDERSRVAYEFMEPRGWEIYGSPSAHALDTMRQAAEASGAPLTVVPEQVAGFLHPGSGEAT